ncbi:hypothetical protein [Devosia sediminis]|uniref:DUF91 domain-containing protein n=1 Tax=Devosia sediminis TaxID=2798801 RepID=A0A934IWR5_9HYPH|nr:hypothetical protein [Devosia sediminis]MBJ3783717.1 hypothetical protein [Devosia sediminis]
MELFSEKFIEDCIAEAPEAFLGQPLELLSQQPRIGGFVPDLVFRGSQGEVVVVEVQQNTLDRHHLYRCLEYRDSLTHDGDISTVILVCEHIPQRYERIAKVHNIIVIAVQREAFLKSAIKYCPKSLSTHLTTSINKASAAHLFTGDSLVRPYAWGEHDKLVDVYRFTVAELGRCGLIEKYRNDQQTSEILRAAEDLMSATAGDLIDPTKWNIDNLLSPPSGWVPPQEKHIKRIQRPQARLRVFITSKNNLSVRWAPVSRRVGEEYLFDWVRYPSDVGYGYDRPEDEVLFLHNIYRISADADQLMHRPDGDERAALGSMMLALIFSMLQHLRYTLGQVIDCQFDSEFCLDLGDEVPTNSWSSRRQINGWRIADTQMLRVEEAQARVANFETNVQTFSIAEMLAALDLALSKPDPKLSMASAIAKELRATGTAVKAPAIASVLHDMMEARDARLAPYSGRIDIR